jgi:hypothetical protein
VKQSLNFLLLAHCIISLMELNITSPEKLQLYDNIGVGVGVGVRVGVCDGDMFITETFIDSPPQILDTVGVGVGVGVGVFVGVTLGVGGM